MRLCRVEGIRPGMHLAEHIYLDDGRLLAAAGTALTQDGINVIAKQGFTTLVIHEDDPEDIEVPEVISGDLRRDLSVRLRQTYDVVRRRLTSQVDKPPTQILKAIHGSTLQRDFASINLYHWLEPLAETMLVELASVSLIDGLSMWRRADPFQIDHSINVAAASIALAFQIPVSGQRRTELGLGALLHDIGMVFVSSQTAAKEGSLTVAEMSRTLAHPRLGYALLQISSSSVWFISNHVALQHHERQDGQGYPRGLFGTNRIARSEQEMFDPERIVQIAEIAAIAETFEALSTDRPYRRALAAEEVRAKLRSMSGHHLNAELVEVFLRILPAYHTGSIVTLRAGELTGCSGVVMEPTKDHMERPRVRMLWSPKGERIKREDIDLASSDLPSSAIHTVTDGESIFRLEGLTRYTVASVGAVVDPKHPDAFENYSDEDMPAFPAELLMSETALEELEDVGRDSEDRRAKLTAERAVLERIIPQSHPIRRLRASLNPSVVESHLQRYQTDEWPLQQTDPDQVFRLYVVQTIFGYEHERDLMMDVHVNMAFRWFCGFGISEDLYEFRALPEFRNAIGHRLFISIANSLLAEADSVIDEVRPRRRTRTRAR